MTRQAKTCLALLGLFGWLAVAAAALAEPAGGEPAAAPPRRGVGAGWC
jgi:hypothetical protein